MRCRGLDLESKTKIKLLEKMSHARGNKIKMPREMSAGGSSDGSSGGGRRKLMSSEELACEEASIKMTMSCLQKRLFVVQEERATLERAQNFDAAPDGCTRSSRDVLALRDGPGSHAYSCERCSGTIRHEELSHKTLSGKRYHADCWERQQKEWQEEAEQAPVCTTCGAKWETKDGDSWRKSRTAKNWYCEGCGIAAGVGGGRH